jgi:hypothetical protein
MGGIVDAHVNLMPQGMVSSDPNSLWPRYEDRLAALREAGITKALAGQTRNITGRTYEEMLEFNRQLAIDCEASGGICLPSAFVSPALGNQTCDLLRYCRKELGMRFLGEIFDRWVGYEWGTPEYRDLLKCAVELHMIPLMHCEDEVIAEIGESYPDGKFMIAHFTGVNGQSCEARLEALAPYPNLYLVTSDSKIAGAEVLKEAVNTIGVERIIFGSDIPSFDPVVLIQCIRRSGLTEAEQNQILWENFWTLWKWTDI